MPTPDNKTNLTEIARQVAREQWSRLGDKARERTDFDELFSEAFVGAAEAIGKLPPTVADPGAYLATAARHALSKFSKREADWRRRRTTHNPDNPQHDRAAPEPDDELAWQAVAQAAQWDAITAALPDESAELLSLRYRDRKSIRAIGSLFGISESGVRKRLTAAIAACQAA
jgi:RNA polymerase sigma factor (sigma-70 family)